jgi:ribonuclease BN (tRNA processing enzyme)
MEPFADHELIFLGTGGGRFHSATQHRRTGGIIYVFNGKQAHIDPGPGAIVYLNKMHMDRLKTKWIIVTHNHTDHQNDVPIIIESIHKSLSNPAGVLISTRNYIDTLDAYYKSLLVNIIPMEAEKVETLEIDTDIIGTKTVHGDTPGFGLIFRQTNSMNPSQKYQIGFTSDTEIYPEFSMNYRDLDILVANVLRPSDKFCPRHACVEELIPALKIAKPKVCILTHFGAMFDPPWANTNIIEEQIHYIQDSVGDSIKIVGACDGMRLKLNELVN